MKEAVETVIEQVDPQADVPEALKEAIKIEMDDLIHFTGITLLYSSFVHCCFSFLNALSRVV